MSPEDGMAATDRLLRPAFGMYRVEWPGSPSVEFHLSHDDWIRLLWRSGFEIEDLIELRLLWEQPRLTPSSLSNGPGTGRAKRCGRRAKRIESWQLPTLVRLDP
jgi:hypothetical protein